MRDNEAKNIIQYSTRFFLLLAASFLVLFAAYAHAQLAPEETQPTEFQNRTTETFIYQSTDILANGSEVHEPFTFSVTEDEPSVTSAFIEITGIAYQAPGSAALTTSIDDSGFTAARVQSTSVQATGNGRSFTILYDVSEYIAGIVTASGDYDFIFDARIEGMEVASMSVELITTYQYVPIEDTLMPVRGNVGSQIFDTGAAVGVGYNALMWRGSLGGPDETEGRVRIQFATSDCPNGAENAPSCDIGDWEFIGGANCSNSDWFEWASDTPLDLQETSCLMEWNDKRYYRYRVELCSVDCEVAGMYTPTVTNVFVNYSP